MKFEIKKVSLSIIKPNPDNPRTISKTQMERLVKSLKEFPEMSQLNPLFIGFRSLKKDIGGIYAIFNTIDERIYIGSSVSITRRIALHKRNLKANKHHSKHLQNFYNKYGKESIMFALLLKVDNSSKQNLIDIEQRFLDVLKPAFNSNMIANSRVGCKHRPESKKKISETRLAMNIRYDDEYKQKMSSALSGKNNPMYGMKGELSPNWGKKHKPETIKKMIKSHHDVKGVNNPKHGIPQSLEATKKALITKRENSLAKGRGIRVIKDNKIISIFHSVSEAAERLNINPSSVYRSIKKRKGKCKNFTLSFTNGYDAVS